jgi:SCY1-like protein 2
MLLKNRGANKTFEQELSFIFRDSYAFCTEPIFASLANVFGNTENISPSPEHLKDFKLVDIEIRHGLFQLGEALSFLHLANMLHGNLCPSSIIINDKGNWKLAGFDFCITGTSTPNGKVRKFMTGNLSWRGL